MCHRGCSCEPCAAQRQIDRRYSGQRTNDPRQYPSQLSTVRRARRRGLTVEQVQAMEEERDNCCDICGKREYVRGVTGKVKSLAIDHCHETGRIRGLLCNNCNRALGLLGHSLGLMEQAVAYLKGRTPDEHSS